MKNRIAGNWVKHFLAFLLLKTCAKPRSYVTRRIDLKAGKVTDSFENKSLCSVENERLFFPIHMASQGYWQKSDDQQKNDF